jgi:hypothetical protein
LSDLWAEIDSTDWRKTYRGIIKQIAEERGMLRQNVWRSLRRTRNLEIGIRAIQLKRQRERKIAIALRTIKIERQLRRELGTN